MTPRMWSPCWSDWSKPRAHLWPMAPMIGAEFSTPFFGASRKQAHNPIERGDTQEHAEEFRQTRRLISAQRPGPTDPAAKQGSGRQSCRDFPRLFSQPSFERPSTLDSRLEFHTVIHEALQLRLDPRIRCRRTFHPLLLRYGRENEVVGLAARDTTQSLLVPVNPNLPIFISRQGGLKFGPSVLRPLRRAARPQRGVGKRARAKLLKRQDIRADLVPCGGGIGGGIGGGSISCEGTLVH